MMSDRVHAARIVAYSGAVTAGFTLGEGWTVSLPFVGIVVIEMIVFAHRIYGVLFGKVREDLLREAAVRAEAQIENRRLEELAREAIQAMPGSLPPEVSQALEDGRLQITVKDDEDHGG